MDDSRAYFFRPPSCLGLFSAGARVPWQLVPTSSCRDVSGWLGDVRASLSFNMVKMIHMIVPSFAL